MSTEQKQPEVKQMDFTITRTNPSFWLNIKLEGKGDYIIELSPYDAMELAEEFDIVIRTEESDDLEESEEHI